MEKCLVLGASGFIGKNLCTELVKSYSVRVLVRKPNEYLEQIGVQEVILDDFSQITDFTPYLEGVDTVYHLISTTLPTEGTEGVADNEIRKNLIPTVNLLESMKRMGNKTIIFASSGGTVYGDHGCISAKETDALRPKSAYGLQKQLIENCLEFYHLVGGLRVRIARISNPYGGGQQIGKGQGVIPIFIRKLLDDEPITVWGGDNLRDYIYMDDLISALIALGEYAGDEYIFNIGSGHVYSIRDVIETIEAVVGKNFDHVTYKHPRSSDVENTCMDITRIQRELNWSPKTSFKDGVERVYRLITQSE